ncbi:hypothetical protein [Endozoicomonas sp.]|uniref:hypothetical protein n=1 Tax=Endozoicomonas sp. TaxID=1892382 RepID=UPI00383A2F13
MVKIIYNVVTFIPGKIWDCIKYICNAIKNSIHDRKVRAKPAPLYQDVGTLEELNEKRNKDVIHACKIARPDPDVEYIYRQAFIAEARLKGISVAELDRQEKAKCEARLKGVR